MKVPRLQIKVDEIPDAGRVIHGELPEAWLEDSVLDAYHALGPARVEISVRAVNESVYVEGSLELELGFECSRTMTAGRTRIRVPVSELFQPAALHALNLGAEIGSEELDGDEPYLFDAAAGVVDLEPLLREQLVLAQPPYPTVPEAGDDAGPAWSSAPDEGDPRWARLRDLDLS